MDLLVYTIVDLVRKNGINHISDFKLIKFNGIQFSLVKKWEEHKAWITNIHLQREGTRELVSGGLEGDIKIWDIRESHSLRTIEAHSRNDMTSLAVHDHSSVIAR